MEQAQLPVGWDPNNIQENKIHVRLYTEPSMKEKIFAEIFDENEFWAQFL